MSKKREVDQDIRLNKKGKPKKFDLLKHWFIVKRDQIRSNLQTLRSILIIGCLGVMFLALLGGWNHSRVKQLNDAMKLSDLDQELTFSQSGVELKLLPPSKNGNMAVIPFKMNGGDETTVYDATNYKVFVRKAGKADLPEHISGSLVMLGTNGYGAVVLRGDLKQAPMQVIIRNDKDLTSKEDSDAGSGKIILDGKEVEVPYNAVAFTTNPKAENVKVKKQISKDMSYPELYKVAVADGQLLSLKRDEDQAKSDLKNAEERKAEMERRVRQLNNALGRDKDDYKYNTKADEESDTASDVFREGKFDDSEYEGKVGSDPENSDLSNADMDTVRNELISQIDTINDDIETYKAQLKTVENNRDELQQTIDSMSDLSTVTNNFGISK